MSGVIGFIGGSTKVALADFDVSRFCGMSTLGLRVIEYVFDGPPDLPPATACEVNSR